MLVQYKKSKKETEKCKRCERRVKNDGWQQTLRNGTTKGRSGKLVASCSRLWNSSAHSCEFCEQQQQRVRPIAVSDGTAARHKQSETDATAAPRPTPGQHPARHLRTSSPPAPRSYVACICQPAGQPTSADGAAENNQMASSAGCRQLFQPRKRNTCAVMSSSTFCLTPTDKRITGRRDGQTDGEVRETDELHAAGNKYYVALRDSRGPILS